VSSKSSLHLDTTVLTTTTTARAAVRGTCLLCFDALKVLDVPDGPRRRLFVRGALRQLANRRLEKDDIYLSRKFAERASSMPRDFAGAIDCVESFVPTGPPGALATCFADRSRT
jgi:hypothetical protein